MHENGNKNPTDLNLRTERIDSLNLFDVVVLHIYCVTLELESESVKALRKDQKYNPSAVFDCDFH
jgi:hypothetical protein